MKRLDARRNPLIGVNIATTGRGLGEVKALPSTDLLHRDNDSP